jgi:hypothetical protein
MNELDRKIREALPPHEAEQLGPLDEPSVWEQVKQLFQGRLWWVSLLLAVGAGVVSIFMVVSAVWSSARWASVNMVWIMKHYTRPRPRAYFFQAEGVREMLAWAGGFGLSLVVVSFCRLWFWLMLHRNAVVREVKRVELQVARLSGRLRMPT